MANRRFYFTVLFFTAAITFLMCCEKGINNNNNNDNSGGDDPETPDTSFVEEITVHPEYEGYTLAWADNFSDSILNTSYWNIEVNGDGGGNNELQYYSKNNVSVETEPESGRHCLVLTARKENYNERTATSGRINSKGKKVFEHGRIEASIKLPRTANGLWPAFWMMGNDYESVGWPHCGEIDILEMGHANGIKAGTSDRYFNGACHWGLSWNGGAYPNYANAFTSSYSLQDTFHLYTLIWDENYIRMYLDKDKYPSADPYYEMNISDRSGDNSPGNYFHKDFFILFNLAVEGNFPQIWDINGVTALSGGSAKMYVDFVRVYRKD